MNRTRVHLAIVLVILVGYTGIALSPGLRVSGEVFPFFRWSLFSRVPDPIRTSYSMRFVEIDGEPLFFPRYFEESRDRFPAAGSAPPKNLLQRWGRAVRQENESEADRARQLFETRYIRGVRSGRYELVRREHHVLERFRCGCYSSEIVVAEYDYG